MAGFTFVPGGMLCIRDLGFFLQLPIDEFESNTYSIAKCAIRGRWSSLLSFLHLDRYLVFLPRLPRLSL